MINSNLFEYSYADDMVMVYFYMTSIQEENIMAGRKDATTIVGHTYQLTKIITSYIETGIMISEIITTTKAPIRQLTNHSIA